MVKESAKALRRRSAGRKGGHKARGCAGALRRTLPATARGVGTSGTAKRAFDVVVSLIALVLLAVPFVLVAMAIRLESPGPVFYRSRRMGYRGRPFLMLKFRKMRHDAEGIPLTADRDDRLTRVGRVLARSRVDELPQFWDVLRGRMSIVGPRPEDPAFVSLRPDDYERILRVRPGLTGLSQIAFADEHKILNPHDVVLDYVERILPQKISLDQMYAERNSFRRDLAVLRWTLAAVVLRKQVAVHRGSGALNLRHRPEGTRPARIASHVGETPAGVL